MKKLILSLVSLVFIAILVSGCSIHDSFKDEPDLTFKTGILYEKPSDGDYLGTHVLLGESSEEFMAVRSLSINLSSEMYLENMVELIGFTNPDDEVFEATGVSVKEVLNPIEDKAPEFIEYKSSDFGVELNYYDDWEVEEIDNELTFTVDDAKVVITQAIFPYQAELDEEGNEISGLRAYATDKFADMVDWSFEPVRIGKDSLPAIQYMMNYDLYRSGFIYSIRMDVRDYGDGLEDIDLNAYEKIFNEMLAEFRFIGYTTDDSGEIGSEDGEEAADDSDTPITSLPEVDVEFSSFESLPYNFSMSYPKNWYYAGSYPTEAGVTYNYGFSDESVEDDNEILMLDIISTDLPSGTPIIIGDFKAVKTGGSLFTSVDNRNFKLSGDEEYQDLMIHMLSSIESIPGE